MEHLTIQEYLEKNPQNEVLLKSIFRSCGNHGELYLSYYIHTNNHCYLIYSLEQESMYFVWAIYTMESDRNKGLSKKLLKSIDNNMLLMFDTFSLSLKHVLTQLGAKEVNYFKSSDADRKQFVLDTSGKYQNTPTEI